MLSEGFREIVSDYPHRSLKLFIEDLFTVIVHRQFVIDIPFVQEVAVFDVRTLIFFEEVGTVFGRSIGDFQRPFRNGVVVQSLS